MQQEEEKENDPPVQLYYGSRALVDCILEILKSHLEEIYGAEK